MHNSALNLLLILPELLNLLALSFTLAFAIMFGSATGHGQVNSQGSHTMQGLHNGSALRIRGPWLTDATDSTSGKSNGGKTCDANANNAYNKSPVIAPTSHIVTASASLMRTTQGFKGPCLQTLPLVGVVISCLILSCVCVMNSGLDYGVASQTGCCESTMQASLIWDPLAKVMTMVLLLSASGALVLAQQDHLRYGRYEFLMLMWLSLIGMLSLIKSQDWLGIYLSIELQSLSFYMLAAMRSRTEASSEAGLKYFILSAFSSALLLLGMALIYGHMGSLNFSDLSLALNHYANSDVGATMFSGGLQAPGFALLAVGLGCLLISLLFKLAAAPYHAWVADVYEGSPTWITAWFAITSKIGVSVVLIRWWAMVNSPDLNLTYNVFAFPAENLALGHASNISLSYGISQPYGSLLTGVAMLSLFIGTLSAMRQVKIKRMLAFSGVANVGWFLLALVSGQWPYLAFGLTIYILLNLSLFSVLVTRCKPLVTSIGLNPIRFAGELKSSELSAQIKSHVANSQQTDQPGGLFTPKLNGFSSPGTPWESSQFPNTLKYIGDLCMLNKLNPCLAFAVSISLFSLAGMPPLAGFYSKYLIMYAMVQSGHVILLALALGAALISAYYYIRLVKTLYFGNRLNLNFQKSAMQNPATLWLTLMPSRANALVIAFTCVLTLGFFLQPDYFTVWFA